MKRGYLAHWRAEPRMAATGLFWRTWHRLHNRWLDARAWAVGACNADTWDPTTATYSGGYSFWRCARDRGHWGHHRFNNYIWRGAGSRVEFKPIEWDRWQALTDPKHRKATRYRHSIDTLRRTRIRHRATEAAYRVQRAGKQ